MTDYKLVPLEPTYEMALAAMNAETQANYKYGEPADFLSIWSAMLAAAPAVQGEPVFMWHRGATDDESEVVDVDCACPCCVPLYAAPQPAPAVHGVPVAHTFYVLHDAEEGQKYIKKDVDDGCLAIFEREEDAQRAKRRHPGTEYKRVDYYATPQPAPDVAALVEAHPPAPNDLIGRTVSMDVSTGDHDACHRLFGTVTGVEGRDGVILCELQEDNQDAEQQPDVAQLVEALRRSFPLLDDEGLDEYEHHCERSIQQERKRLHTILDLYRKQGGDV